MDTSLTGKVALVCGASQGIGMATAKELAVLGCRVISLARNESKLKVLTEELNNISGLNHKYLSLDVTNHAELERKLNEILKEVGVVSIWVNNTGGPKGGLISEAEPSEFANAFKHHLETSVLISKLLIPGMKKENYGRIINVLSTSVKQPIPSLGVSTTVRWAVASWAKTLSKEIARFGITVNSVLPGSTDTGRLKEVIENEAKRGNTTVDEIIKKRTEFTPINRFAKPEEIANVIAFLASPAASYVNGVAIPVDGGQTLSI